MVWRQDDNGHEAVVRSGLTRDEAERTVSDLETRGHKQLYSIRPDTRD
jgi:hypothetical protein